MKDRDYITEERKQYLDYILQKEQLRRQRISDAMKGKTKSEETKKKISEALKGKPKSEQAKRKMSEWHQMAAKIIREYMEKKNKKTQL